MDELTKYKYFFIGLLIAFYIACFAVLADKNKTMTGRNVIPEKDVRASVNLMKNEKKVLIYQYTMEDSAEKQSAAFLAELEFNNKFLKYVDENDLSDRYFLVVGDKYNHMAEINFNSKPVLDFKSKLIFDNLTLFEYLVPKCIYNNIFCLYNPRTNLYDAVPKNNYDEIIKLVQKNKY